MEIPGRYISLANGDVLLFQTSLFRSSVYLTLTAAKYPAKPRATARATYSFSNELFHVRSAELRRRDTLGIIAGEFDPWVTGKVSEKTPLWMSGAQHPTPHAHARARTEMSQRHFGQETNRQPTEPH